MGGPRRSNARERRPAVMRMLNARDATAAASRGAAPAVHGRRAERTQTAVASAILVVECKEWGRPVGSAEVTWFVEKLRSRALDHGVLVAEQGITGDAEQGRAAQHIIAGALRDGLRVIVVTGEDLRAVRSGRDVVKLLQVRLCELTIRVAAG